MDKHAIGARVKKVRLKLGLTQEELAERIGCGPTYISDIERGAKFPSMDLFIRLVNALGISADFILLGEVDAGKTFLYDELTQKLEQLTPGQREQASRLIDAYINIFFHNA